MSCDLGKRIVVLSPHLDDAVLSVGGTIAAHVEAGGTATVLTLFAGDTRSLQNAGAWDVRSEFTTAGAAARHRRQEDKDACDRIGASTIWLPNDDGQYRNRRNMEDLVGQVAAAIAGYDVDAVLAPGWPLSHTDHAWTLFVALQLNRRLVLYAEEPYKSWLGPSPLPPPVIASSQWTTAAGHSEATWMTASESKLEAIRRYETQLALLKTEMRAREFADPLDQLLAKSVGRGEPLAEPLRLPYSRS